MAWAAAAGMEDYSEADVQPSFHAGMSWSSWQTQHQEDSSELLEKGSGPVGVAGYPTAAAAVSGHSCVPFGCPREASLDSLCS